MFNKSFFANLPPVTKNLLIINIIVWAFMAIAPETSAEKLVDLGGLHYVTSRGFGIWQIFTYMFIHGGFVHLFFNMWALLMFGYAIERSLGSGRFLFFYLTCGIGAGIIQEVVYIFSIDHYAGMLDMQAYTMVREYGWDALQQGKNFVDPTMATLNLLINSATVGASGAIFGILLAVGMLFPNNEMYIMFIPYPIKAKWVVLGYGVIELLLGIAGPADGIAHFAHLGGMLFGFILLKYWINEARKKRGF